MSPSPSATALGAGRAAARSRQLQRLRPLPHRGTGPAHVPDLPGHARRGRHAAGQGQPDAAPAPAGRRSDAGWSSDEVRGRRRPVRQLQDVRASNARPTSTCRKLMLEAKAANVARARPGPRRLGHGPHRDVRPPGQRPCPAGQRLAGQPPVRWLLEKLFGLSRRRRLPAFAARSFLRSARRRGWTRKPRSARPRVAYFVDVFANYNDPPIAEAVVAVLHHNGIEVYVPPGQVGCGMAPLAYGDVETARETAQHNLRLLADLAREGYPILCSEPTAALMLRQDALDLLDDPDARLVAAQTVECTAFLWDLHQQGRLQTDFQPPGLSRGPSRALPPQGARPAAGRAGAAVVDPRPARAYNRRELLRHGRHVWPEGRQLRTSRWQPAGRCWRNWPGRACCSARRSAAPAGCRWKTGPANAPCTPSSIWPWLTA